MAAGHVADDELRHLRVAPHQNETATMAAQPARELTPYLICRPLAIMTLNRPLLYICDEPVVLNAPDGEFHIPDCALTNAEIEERVQRQLRKVKQRKRGRAKVCGRTIHFSSTMPTGHGVADEILLAISPRTALLWGPLTEVPQEGPVKRVTLGERESTRFAEMANRAMCAQALDWIITRTDDEAFSSRDFPPTGPLMRVCDGTNAAAPPSTSPRTASGRTVFGRLSSRTSTQHAADRAFVSGGARLTTDRGNPRGRGRTLGGMSAWPGGARSGGLPTAGIGVINKLIICKAYGAGTRDPQCWVPAHSRHRENA